MKSTKATITGNEKQSKDLHVSSSAVTTLSALISTTWLKEVTEIFLFSKNFEVW